MIPAAAGTALGGAQAASPKNLDEALASLKTYDWGVERKTLKPIDDAINATYGDAAARAKIEKSLVATLEGGTSRSAVDYICRRLRVIGTKACVKALAKLLGDPGTSHIARYALERLEDPTAVAAIRAALPKAGDKIKPGLIGSLGVRRDKTSVSAIARCLGDKDPLIAKASCKALALIGSPEAARALGTYVKKAPKEVKVPAADACLICAEQLAADGKKTDAKSLYTVLKGANVEKMYQIAAMRGLSGADKK
jgi:HEAT repeat protein